MIKSKLILPISFGILSSLVFSLMVYLISVRAKLYSQSFLTTCGEILKDITSHLHINYNSGVTLVLLFIVLVSLLLAVVRVIQFILSYQRLSKQFQDTSDLPRELVSLINKHHLQNTSFIITTEDNLMAYTVGLIKPQIVLSQSLVKRVNKFQLEAIILHELYHVKNKHLLWLLLVQITSSLLFFIPLIQYLARQLKTEFELAADSFVVQKQKTNNHIRSSLALRLEYSNGVIPYFSTSPIEQRVGSLFNKKVVWEKIKFKQLIISLVSIILIMGLGFTSSSQAKQTSYQDLDFSCQTGEECQTPDCLSHPNLEVSLERPMMSTVFQLQSSY